MPERLRLNKKQWVRLSSRITRRRGSGVSCVCPQRDLGVPSEQPQRVPKKKTPSLFDRRQRLLLHFEIPLEPSSTRFASRKAYVNLLQIEHAGWNSSQGLSAARVWPRCRCQKGRGAATSTLDCNVEARFLQADQSSDELSDLDIMGVSFSGYPAPPPPGEKKNKNYCLCLLKGKKQNKRWCSCWFPFKSCKKGSLKIPHPCKPFFAFLPSPLFCSRRCVQNHRLLAGMSWEGAAVIQRGFPLA